MSSDQLLRVRCGVCGAPLPASAAGPICPRCALGGALETTDAEKPAEGHNAEAQKSPQPSSELLGDATLPVSPSEGPGAVINRYKLLEKIGEGGFGAVYLAEQREPLKRRVALKVIK